MNMRYPRSKIPKIVIFSALFYLLLAFDGNTHWDETNYLFKGAYAAYELDAPWVHYSGGFYSGRMFHILVLRVLFSIFGTGPVPVFLVELTMAFGLLGAGWLFFLSLREIDCRRPLTLLAALSLLFLPLTLYLGYKSLAETTALLAVSLSLYLYFRAAQPGGWRRLPPTMIAGTALFLATNSRVESLLTFAALVLPWLCFSRGRRPDGLRALAAVAVTWVALTAILGLSAGIWSLEFLSRRAETYGAKFAADSLDYLPNPVVAVLFGGGLWFFALLSLRRLRLVETRIAWGGLAVAMVPVMLLADHTELRYYHPALFPFALAVAVGIESFYDLLRRKIRSRLAVAATLAVFVILVAGNQLLRPFQEVGTEGLPLLRLMSRVRERYPDPLVLTAHPHSTYSFLRICCPGMRIALDRDFEGAASLQVNDPAELSAVAGPRIYLSSRGPRPRPLLIRLLHRLRGGGPEEPEGPPVIATGWLAGSRTIALEPVDREGRYLVFEIREVSD